MPSRNKPTLDTMISSLMTEVTSPSHDLGSLEGEWKHYMKMRDMTEQIQEKEAARDSTDEDSTWPNDMERRKANLPAFIEWLAKNGIAHDKVEPMPVSPFGANEPNGFGLRVKEPIKNEEIVLQIPVEHMITAKNARESKLEILTLKDPMLKTMDNVLLAIYLLLEKYITRDASVWKPYIDILPRAYDTILYFKPDEMKLLLQSPNGFRESVKMYRNIARQYCYLHGVFRKATDSGSRALRNIFTFRRYAWAVSTVITRQNQVPRPGSAEELSLVPLWDLCNHQETTQVSTGYSPEENALICYASQDYDPGDEFKIFYGFRTSVEYFVHGGFVAQSHCGDVYSLDLGISKNDPNLAKKKMVLGTLGLSPQSSFAVKPDRLSVIRPLFVFIRIFLADNETLDKIEDQDYNVMAEPTEQAWKFLTTRFTLLKQSAENTLNKTLKMIFEEYKIVSQDEKQLSVRQLMVLQLLKNEKKLLDVLANCCNDHLSQMMKPTDAE